MVELNDRRLVALVQRRLPDGGRVMTFEDVTQSRRAQDRVMFLARHDAMTGLPNRVQLAELALARLELARGLRCCASTSTGSRR